MLCPDKLGLKLFPELPVVVAIDCCVYLCFGVCGVPNVDTLSTYTPARILSKCVAVRLVASDGLGNGLSEFIAGAFCFTCSRKS